MLPVNPTPRLALPLFAAFAGAAALGAVAVYRALTRTRATAVVKGRAPGSIPRATVVVESDGPVREPVHADVPW